MEKERKKYFTKEAMQLGHCGEKEFCSRRSDKDTFYTANAPESLVPDEKNATWELNKDGRRNANAIEASCVGNEVASRKLDSASMYHELATVISEKREWTRTHKGAMCAANAMKPFVRERSGRCGCSWAPIVR